MRSGSPVPAASGAAAPLDIRPGAQSEARAAARYYDDRAPQLGDEFLAEPTRVLDAVATRPDTGAPFAGRYRRMLLRRFPYAVVYRHLASGSIRVLAIAHLRRRPDYWQRRDEA